MPIQAIMMNDTNTFDVLIIGGGPAALAASIYLSRSGYKNGYIEKNVPGGKLVNIQSIDNYPGFKKIAGSDLALNMYEQVEALGGIAIFGEVTTLDRYKDYHVIYTSDGGVRYCKSLIIATGISENKLNCKNAEHYYNKGISNCALCDASLSKDQNVVVLGSSFAAINNAMQLTKIANHVTLINEHCKFDVEDKVVKNLSKFEKLEVLTNSKIDQINGDNKSISSIDVITNNQKHQIRCKFVFVYIGIAPQTHFIHDKSLLDNKGFIIHNENMETSIPGMFTAGDCASSPLKQISTATASGITAAISAIKYLNSKKINADI